MRKPNKPTNCINIDSIRKLFIGFNKEDYFYLRDIIMNASMNSSHIRINKNGEKERYRKMPRMKFFIVLEYGMDFKEAFRYLEFLIRRINHYDKNGQQIKIILLTLGDYYMRSHFTDFLDELGLIGKGIVIDDSFNKSFSSNGKVYTVYEYHMGSMLRRSDIFKCGIEVDMKNIFMTHGQCIYRHEYTKSIYMKLDNNFNNLIEYLYQRKDGFMPNRYQ